MVMGKFAHKATLVTLLLLVSLLTSNVLSSPCGQIRSDCSSNLPRTTCLGLVRGSSSATDLSLVSVLPGFALDCGSEMTGLNMHFIYFQVAINGLYSLRAVGRVGNDDPVLQVSTCTGQVLGCNDDFEEHSRDSLLSLTLQAGVQYIAALTGQDRTDSGSVFDFYISRECGCAAFSPSICLGTIQESNTTILSRLSLDGATLSSALPCGSTESGLKTMTFQFQAETTNFYTISTEHIGDSDTTLAIYSCNNRLIACNDDVGSNITNIQLQSPDMWPIADWENLASRAVQSMVTVGLLANTPYVGIVTKYSSDTFDPVFDLQFTTAPPVEGVVLTSEPSSTPTLSPSVSPSLSPSSEPSLGPTKQPSHEPTAQPSSSPTLRPSKGPSSHPTTAKPSQNPSASPSSTPSERPSSSTPSAKPTGSPSLSPSSRPTTTSNPTPLLATASPNSEEMPLPTSNPSAEPSSRPTSDPSAEPSSRPTASPSVEPSSRPTSSPTAEPSSRPSSTPSSSPVREMRPTSNPTATITVTPTMNPTGSPFATLQPVSTKPSSIPSSSPSYSPSDEGEAVSTKGPSSGPTESPDLSTNAPTSTVLLTTSPSSILSTMKPSQQPSISPSLTRETDRPSTTPSKDTTSAPTGDSTQTTPTSSPTSTNTTGFDEAGRADSAGLLAIAIGSIAAGLGALAAVSAIVYFYRKRLRKEFALSGFGKELNGSDGIITTFNRRTGEFDHQPASTLGSAHAHSKGRPQSIAFAQEERQSPNPLFHLDNPGPPN